MARGATDKATHELIRLLEEALSNVGPRLVRLPVDLPVIYVGDIHGDHTAVDTICTQFPSSDCVLVFLGDIVDRGPDSRGALAHIAREKIQSPDHVHLLMGNHEALSISPFRPADFWDSLREDQSGQLSHHLEKLPLAAWHPTGILATHGGLPDLPILEAIDDVPLGSESWRAITWGDWVDKDSQAIPVGKRPSFGPTAFEERSSQLDVVVHIRSHQPTCPLYSFADRCLTLFTSTAYGKGPRRVARWVPGQSLHTARDLALIEI
ncbi:serine/threonine protein phosphatase [Candidatus Bipolaricaulota bacterium]|nr:serine/threonine protein phosphatase [Candidatus Bipolaricaulota bacterium]